MQIVNLLRQVKVTVANGRSLAQVCKEAKLLEQTYIAGAGSLAG